MRRSKEHRAGTPTITQIAAQITPYKQGAFDGLCGVYAIINALQLAAFVHRPLSRSKAQALFVDAITYLRREKAHLNPVAHGMSDHMMTLLAEFMINRATTKTLKYSVERYQRQTSGDFAIWLDDGLTSGAAIIVSMVSPPHFSVVANKTKAGLILFDSQTLPWLPIKWLSDLKAIFDFDGVLRIRAIPVR